MVAVRPLVARAARRRSRDHTTYTHTHTHAQPTTPARQEVPQAFSYTLAPNGLGGVLSVEERGTVPYTG